MRSLIEAFPSQIREALAIGSQATLHPRGGINAILVTGLGGSGIGGKITSHLVADTCEIPFLVNNEYHLPHWVDEHTLVIVSSYSGGTEETLSAMQEAIERGCAMACITSGGEVLEKAKEHGLDHIIIPGGNPPRSMLAYSLIQQLFVLRAYKLWNGEIEEALSQIALRLEEQREVIARNAMDLAVRSIDRLPVIYTDRRLEGVAIRWRQQINENGKKLAWHNVIPEMNHNELVGWETGDEALAVIILQDGMENERNRVRTEICRGIFSAKTHVVETINAVGSSDLERVFHLIYFGDWYSLHLAELGNQDPVQIRNIDLLKNELSKI